MTLRSMARAIRDIAWSGVSTPVRAVVDRSYARAETGGYVADLEVVHRVTLKRAGEKLRAVPLQPVWLGANGRGLYAPPQEGQYVIVGWVEGDRGHPYIAGASADEYRPAAAAAAGELALVDGRGHELRVTEDFVRLVDGDGGELKLEGLWRLATKQESLRPVLEALIDAVRALSTTGPPAPHTVSAATRAELMAVRERLGQLLET